VADGGPFGVPLVVVFGLFAAVAWGGGDFAGGLAARRAPVFAIVLGSQAVGMVLALVLAIARAEPVPAPVDLAWSSLAGLSGAAGLLALYHGLAVGRISVVAPVTGVLGAGVPVLVGVLLEGVPPPIVLAGIALGVVAVVLVSRGGDESARRSGVELGLVAGLGIGLFNVTITRVDESIVFGPLVVVRLTATAALLVALLVTRRPTRPPRDLWPMVAAVGLLDMAGNAGFLFAEQTGSLAVASILSSLYPVTTVVLAALFLRERVQRSHAAGIVLAFAAIGMIVAGSTPA
jgi:drug/metabolite transporter (DMT)-like permease